MSHRTAFNTKGQNAALEYNLDKIVHMTSLKVKELISKKQEIIKENSLLKGQKSVRESDINHQGKEIQEKEEQLTKLQEEFLQIQKEIEELEKELKGSVHTSNDNNESLKLTIIGLNEELSNVTIANGVEETNKKISLKMELEKYLEIKTSNKLLVDQMHDLRRELYYLEVRT